MTGKSLKYPLVVLAAATSVFFTNLGGAGLWDDDEPKNAQCALEMLRRGDYLVPTFNDELRYDKPVLVYWLMISAYRTFGVSEFAARFWSAALAVATTWIAYLVGRTLFRPRVGMWAGLMLSASLLFVVAGRAATPDAALIFCTTWALWTFVRTTWGAAHTMAGADELRDFLPKSWWGLAGVYAALGLGVLAKGPVGVILPIAALGLYLLCVRQTLAATRRSRENGRPDPGRRWLTRLRFASPHGWLHVIWSLRPLTAMAVVAAVALPWYVAVGLATQGDWPAGFLARHNVGRFLATMERHSGPVYYYIPAILAGFFPWSVFLPGSLFDAARQLRRSGNWPAYLFLLCWSGVYVVFFSFSATKLPSYVLPAYPAMAVLSAAFFDGWLRGDVRLPRWLLLVALTVPGIIGLGFLGGWRIAAMRFLPGEQHLGLIGLIPAAGAAAACWFAWHDRRRHVAVAFAAASQAFAIAGFDFVSERVARFQNSPSLAAALESSAGRRCWATFDYVSPSLVFYTRRRVEPLKTVGQVRRFLAADAQALVVTRSEGFAALQAELGSELVVVMRQRRLLRDEEVLVLSGTNAFARRGDRPKTPVQR